LNDNQVNEKMQ